MIPTETVWGLAARLDRPEAVRRIFQLKGRDETRPLQVLLQRVEQVSLVALPNQRFDRLQVLLPGPLTVVLEATQGLPDLGSRDSTVGVRVPAHAATQALLAVTGPLAASSANLSGQPPPASLEDVRKIFSDEVAYADDQKSSSSVASTVVTLVGVTPKVLRLGDISISQLQEVLGEQVERGW